jgi:uncharacterized protein YeaO (DUF488 family)
MIHEIHTRQWNGPTESDDGQRILICRYRPRGVSKADETWDQWLPQLGPSKELHAAYYGKGGKMPATWSAYQSRYLTEMRAQKETIQELAQRVFDGEQITLLCSSACTRESRCHRSLLKSLIERQVEALTHAKSNTAPTTK